MKSKTVILCTVLLLVVFLYFALQKFNTKNDAVVEHSEYLELSEGKREQGIFRVVRNKEQLVKSLSELQVKSPPSFVDNIEWSPDRVLLVATDSQVTRVITVGRLTPWFGKMLVVNVLPQREKGIGFAVLRGKVDLYIKFKNDTNE